jgi:hypothetical protein
MGFLSRVLNDKAPRLRPSEKACVPGYGQKKDSYRVVVRPRAMLTSGGRAIGPDFETDEQAQKFADWCNGVIKKFN